MVIEKINENSRNLVDVVINVFKNSWKGERVEQFLLNKNDNNPEVMIA